MYQTLLTDTQGATQVITINRPEKLNALNRVVIQELSDVIDEVLRNPDIRSAIITGSGPKSFVAGADISEFKALNAMGGKQLALTGHQKVFDKIDHSPKPFIAAVNGFALGGGCELALACHFRVASDIARFGQPEVNLGLIPGYGGTQRLTQIIGKGRALELLLTGTMIDAATALRYGLVNYVVTPEELIPKTISLSEQINNKAPLAVAGCIKAANAVFDEKINGLELEAEIFGSLFETADATEGAAAFLEKRKPLFKGQ